MMFDVRAFKFKTFFIKHQTFNIKPDFIACRIFGDIQAAQGSLQGRFGAGRVDVGSVCSQAIFGAFFRRFGTVYVDVLRFFRSRRDDRDRIVMDFQEARRYGDVLALSAFVIAQGQIDRDAMSGAWLGMMPGHRPGADEDEIHVFMEYGSIGVMTSRWSVFPASAIDYSPFSVLAFSYASSILPTI